MNIIFKHFNGLTITMCLDYGTTVSEMLMNYWKKIEKPELFGSKQFSFIYNSSILNCNDKTKIEEKFDYSKHPISIFVNDNYNIIGG